ncbi:hypothetical protein GCM10023336_35870 [Streptomyces similanensis]|uniref:Uncharacterized protein n=1 Tax=Streptomyces similanensis TaxID=1274988 RepID=A0ABP9KJB7_9ACTN
MCARVAVQQQHRGAVAAVAHPEPGAVSVTFRQLEAVEHAVSSRWYARARLRFPRGAGSMPVAASVRGPLTGGVRAPGRARPPYRRRRARPGPSGAARQAARSQRCAVRRGVRWGAAGVCAARTR